MNLLFRADAAEEAFLRLIDTLQASEDLEQSWSSQRVESTLEARRHELSQAKTTLAAIERKRDRAWEAHAAGNITGDQLQERLAQLDHDRVNTASIIRELDGQIGAATASLTERATAGEVLRNARRLYKSADPDRQRQIARLVARALGGLTLKKPMELMIGTAMETG
jgi:chromosome segregation ATPase